MTRYMMTCCLCDAEAEKFSRSAIGWDWFTCYLDETMHFCPACRRIHAQLVGELHQRATFAPMPPLRRHPANALLRSIAQDIAMQVREKS